MSDGNFNRQLLPKTELSSGLRAGRAQMRIRAEQAFSAFLDEHMADADEDLKAKYKQEFHARMMN